MFPFSRSTFESSPSAASAEEGGQRTSEILDEVIMDSVSSVRDSLPEQYRAHFETLRQEIIDFTKAHGISRESLGKPDLLREATYKLSIPDLERLALLLERFEYLLKNGEPKKEDYAEALEHAERLYHLREQYDSQVSLLEQVGILKEGAIVGIDGHEYPVPTLKQIASRLFERREILKTKHDQGFTKLLLVPFGMSLDALQETLKQFLLEHKKNNPTFNFDTNEPLWVWEEYQGADIGDSPKLVYYPQSFTKEGHGGKTKMEILREQEDNQHSFPGWTVHLFQPSHPSNPHSPGFAPIPRKGQRTPQGDLVPRPPLEAGKSPNKYLSIFQKAREDEDSPYHGETGMTPEVWITAFMIHLSETGKPLDDVWKPTNTESTCFLTGTGVLLEFSDIVPVAHWDFVGHKAFIDRVGSHSYSEHFGVRSSVIV